VIARVASGHTAAAPPRRVMKLRRLMASPPAMEQTTIFSIMGCVVSYSKANGVDVRSGSIASPGCEPVTSGLHLTPDMSPRGNN
jgi:hypothetical protein